MWNVKRVLILIAGLFAGICCFALYALFLGNIDAMPPLPVSYLEERNLDECLVTDAPEVDKKLIQSFGPICEELQRPLRLWLADKLVAIAAGDFIIEKDGRVKLAPFSAALYHKAKTPNAFPEISTIRADIALLTMDKPVSSYAELNTRKVIAVEMIGRKPGIAMTNNRRTAEKGDDIDVLVTNGNLFYAEQKNLIWTEGVVCLKDYQTKPPTEIRGRGLKMFLAKDTNPNRPRVSAKAQAAPPANDNGGVDKILLDADVDMHFWVDGKSGFLGGTPNAKNSVPPPADAPRADDKTPPDRAHIHIRTGGPFFYDLTKEIAWFESPPVRDDGNALSETIAPDQVHVVRLQMAGGKKKFDQLICDRLDLQFRKKAGAAANNPDVGGGDKEIETALATRRGKNEVVLSLDSEEMAAYGSKLFYRIGDAANGPLTKLWGEPLKSFKDGHKMICKQLDLYAANRAGDGQKVEAQGPGQIDLIDGKNPGKPAWPMHVFWADTLTMVKEKEGGEVFDLMTVNRDASFVDDQQKQELHGQIIRVWIRQVQESAKKPEAAGGPRQEVHRVIAERQVHATSPDFIIRQADEFTISFLQKAPPSLRLPAAVAEAPTGNNPPIIENKNGPSPMDKNPPAEEKKQPEPPIEITANKITAAVFTLGAKKELQDLVAKGNVYVFQPGDKPGEKRIDIIGQLLTVKYEDKGHILVVHGDQKNLGRLEMGELILWGPRITIDRGTNHADVAGHGAMQMPSNKNLDGTDTPKDKKPGRVTVYWNQRMDFDGRTALFMGGVQAFQQDSFSKMQCENLTAYLDKFVSFKEGANEQRNAKLDRLICDRNVYIDDTQIDLNKQFQQRNIITGRYVVTNNNEGGTNVTGPGEVRSLGRSSSNTAGPAPQPLGADSKPTPAKQEWKLTHVKFSHRMFAPKTQGGNKNATFYGENQGVEVFHFPTRDINATMNADRPALDCLYLRCGVLQVEGRQQGDRTTQFMKAQVNCEFRTDKYLGYADIITYNEETDILILEAKDGNRVRLFEFQPDNQPPRPMTINSSKVLYNRRANTIESAGVKSISN